MARGCDATTLLSDLSNYFVQPLVVGALLLHMGISILYTNWLFAQSASPTLSANGHKETSATVPRTEARIHKEVGDPRQEYTLITSTAKWIKGAWNNLRRLGLPQSMAELPDLLDNHIATIIMFSQAVLASAVSTGLQTFVCQEGFQDGVHILKAAPNIVCTHIWLSLAASEMKGER